MELTATNSILPRCQYFGRCGGCKNQDQAYPLQLSEKELLVSELFGSAMIAQKVDCIVESVSPWRYRNKMEFTFSQDKKGQRFLGLIMSKSRGRVITLEECHLTPHWYTEILGRVYQWWAERGLNAYSPVKGTGLLRTLTVRGNRNRMVILTVAGGNDSVISDDDIESFKHVVAFDNDTSVYITTHRAVKKQPTTFLDQHVSGPAELIEHMQVLNKDYLFSISPRAFFQPNIKMAELMYADIVRFLELKGEEAVLDLYCGTGSIGIIVSSYVKTVLGVEIGASAVRDAQRNIELNGVENMEVFVGDVGHFLSDSNRQLSADVVIIDPPRAGLDEKTISFLNTARPEKILYVSCNPQSQVNDIQSLKGYRVAKISPYDQFPHTRHVENIVLLKRIDNLQPF